MSHPADALSANQKQAEDWNGEAGRAWIEGRALLDGIYQPVLDAILEECPPETGKRVLDIGCGTGALTVAYARHLNFGPTCLGVDISSPMIETAKARSESEGTSAKFIHADAQSYPFEQAGYDLLVSRFGVMFFDDPVRAFVNLRRAAKPAAKACFAVWRGPADNSFMHEAEIAAAPFLPPFPTPDPDAPGRFAFSDRDKITTILRQSGWTGITVFHADIPCSFRLEDLDYVFTRFGRIGAAFRMLDDATQSLLKQRVRPVFYKHVIADEVRFKAGCWIVTAHASGNG
jgi:SAM-dependent methyltransferase